MRYSTSTPHTGCNLLCKACHGGAIETVDRKEWFPYHDFAHGVVNQLPVLHRYHVCTICSHEEPDEATGREHAMVIAAYKRPDAHYWTPFPTSYCQQCGTSNPVEQAIRRGYFDPEDREWIDTEEAANAQWNVARINLIGCHVKHPFTFH